jgi:hypothetical protein
MRISSSYRAKRAIAEGRVVGKSGRPPLLQPDEVEILIQRIHNLIIQNVQVTSLMVMNLVFYIIIITIINRLIK